MKLSPLSIQKIEKVLTDYESMFAHDVMAMNGLTGKTAQFSHVVKFFREVGVNIPSNGRRKIINTMSDEERAAMIVWLQERRSATSSNGADQTHQ